MSEGEGEGNLHTCTTKIYIQTHIQMSIHSHTYMHFHEPHERRGFFILWIYDRFHNRLPCISIGAVVRYHHRGIGRGIQLRRGGRGEEKRGEGREGEGREREEV